MSGTLKDGLQWNQISLPTMRTKWQVFLLFLVKPLIFSCVYLLADHYNRSIVWKHLEVN